MGHSIPVHQSKKLYWSLISEWLDVIHDKVVGSGRRTKSEHSDLNGDFISVIMVCLKSVPTKPHKPHISSIYGWLVSPVEICWCNGIIEINCGTFLRVADMFIYSPR